MMMFGCDQPCFMVNKIGEKSCQKSGEGGNWLSLEEREQLSKAIYDNIRSFEKGLDSCNKILHIREVQEGDNLGRLAEALSRMHIQLKQVECEHPVQLKDRDWSPIPIEQAQGWKETKVYYAFIGEPSKQLEAQAEENYKRILYNAATIYPGQYVGVTNHHEVIVADKIDPIVASLVAGTKDLTKDLEGLKGELQYIRPIRSDQFTLLSPSNSILTDGDLGDFYKNGYLIKRGFYSKQQVEEMAQSCERLSARVTREVVFDKNFRGELSAFINGSQFVVEKRSSEEESKEELPEISCKRVVGCLSAEPDLKPFLRSKEIVHSFSRLFNSSLLEHLIAQYHPKEPGDGVAFFPHRDIQYRKLFDPLWKDLNERESYAVAIISIDPAGKENGGLWVIPKTHRDEVPDDEEIPSIEELEGRGDAVVLQTEPGDLVILHPYLLHWIGPNYSKNQSRRTLLTAFCVLGANHKPYPGRGMNMIIQVDETEKGFIEIDSGLPLYPH